MGTNYYHRRDVCECCKRPGETLHIGKSSSGWRFSLHVRGPGEEGWSVQPVDLAEWAAAFDMERSEIRDEYGDLVTKEEMLRRITDRQGDRPEPLRSHREYDFCIGQGEDGDYDLMVGYFS